MVERHPLSATAIVRPSWAAVNEPEPAAVL